MLTFQGIMMRTQYITEQLRRNAIDETLEQFKTAARAYYTNGYDNGETVKLIKELESLGADMDVVYDIDYNIREECKEVPSCPT
jgi:hypothetical protein